ncbi:PAS domain S-box protein [Flavobacterium sp. P4023]|uniref:histidine kinase n=1 Tax=Flavobacterium flabelliforme TaxID=2816119 RepID=A0ABS5CV65_9FLAO|nr:PAS domain S-box protein [Flavobacterium flabelliforme]MBP4142497.1 PAS domain S-box protein [Flavobacterium flabelliforme]
MNNSNDQYYFLKGGGKMGDLIRKKDWTKTPLGLPEKWSQNLQAAVSLVLNNPLPMYIAWGKECTQIYNDAYLPILGKQQQLDSLDFKPSDTLSQVWQITKDKFDLVMKGEFASSSSFILTLYRDGSLKNCYFDFAYSPIFLQDGEIGGTLVTIFETTAKQIVDQELQESEKRFKTLADNIPNLAWMADAKGSLYWYNKQWYEYTGTSFEDMQGWGWKSVFKEKELEAVLKEWNTSLKTGQPFEMVYPIKGADGVYNQFLTRALPVKNDAGEITTWFGTNTNINPQKLAERALDESKNELEFVIEAAKLGTFDYDPITNKFTSNNRLKEWFGLSAEQDIDLYHGTKVIKEKDKSKVITAIDTALQFSSGGIYDICYDIVNPISKKEITLHAKGKALFNSDKKAFRFNGTVEDITEQTIARKKLEQSENNLRLIILQAPMAIAILRGPKYVVEIANKSALDLWTKTEEEVYNTSVFDSIPELALQGIQDILDKVRTTKQHFSTTELPLKIMRYGILETVFMNFSYEPLFDDEGNSDKIMVLGFDVTTQVRARKEIEKSEHDIRSIVESAPFPIAVYTGSEMRITLANQSMIEAWGKGSGVIGKLYKEVLPELENQNIYEQISGVFATGIPFHAKNQKVEILKNGILKSFYFNYSFTPLRDLLGTIYGVMNTAAEVTELNEAKKRIEESEKRFRDSVHQAPVAIVIFRGEENIVEMANAPYLELVDKTESEFLSKPLFSSLPEVEQSIDPIIKGIYQTKKAFYGYEFPVVLKRFGNKEDCYFNFVYQPLIESDTVVGIIVVATDVTANVRAKKELENKEQRLNIVINASELGVWELDLKNNETKVSQRALEILGLPGEKKYNRELLSSKMHKDDLIIRKTAFKEALKNGILYYEIRIIIDEVIHWIEAKGKVFFDLDKKPLRIIGTLRDVTDEKNIQNELLEREQKFRLLADSMPQFVWTANREGKLTYFNQAVYDFSGYSKEEMIEKGWLSIVHDEEKEENRTKWIEAVSTEKNFIIEHRFRKNDGTYRWQLSRAIPQRDKSGVITMWVGTSTDIQDQKMFTNELEKQVSERTKEIYDKNEALEKMNRELQSFAYISSHDLQEPLRKIQTFATQLQQSEAKNLSDKGLDKFHRMRSAADRMQTLIQDLLAYSRTSVQERSFKRTKLSDIIDEVKEDLEEDFEGENSNITIRNDCEIDIIPFQFRQVLFNLISNSLKFTKPNQNCNIVIDSRLALNSEIVTHDLDPDREYCYIKFTDNGIGFEEEYSEKIFEVFQRLHGKEKFEGTGIGLAIVKRIIDNHNGRIVATGVLNEGATFEIFIPYQKC